MRHFTYFPYIRNAILYLMNDVNSHIQLLSTNEGVDGRFPEGRIYVYVFLKLGIYRLFMLDKMNQ